jgi:hypothetical protein
MVEEANKILKQAGLHLEFDKDNDIKTNVSDGGNDDGMLTKAEMKGLFGKPALDELREKFKREELGYKLYIAGTVIAPGIGGATQHLGLNTIALLSLPFTALKLNTAPGASAELRGNDLAHEVAHAFTLSSQHHISEGPPRVDADDMGHAPDIANLMYSANRTNLKRGTQLTSLQIAEIKKGARKWAKKVQRVGDPVIMRIIDKHGSGTDALGDASPDYIDLHVGLLFAEGPTSSQGPSPDLKIGLLLAGLHPQGVNIRSRFELFFNTDDDPATGAAFGPFTGIDKILRISLTGQFPFTAPAGEISAALVDVATNTAIALTPGEVVRMRAILEAFEPSASSSVIDTFDGITQSLPLALLGALADRVPIGVWATDLEAGGFDEASLLLDVNPPPGPRIEVSPLIVEVGSMVNVTGTNFPPLSPITLLVDDVVVQTAVSSAAGSFSASFRFPAEAFNYDRDRNGRTDRNDVNAIFASRGSTEDYFVTARAPNGGFDYEPPKGLITVNDARRAVLNCTDPGCRVIP